MRPFALAVICLMIYDMIPADRLLAAGMDIVPPAISHTTTHIKQPLNEDITIGAAITDSSGIKSATLFYRPDNEEIYRELPMLPGPKDRHYATMPAGHVTGSAMEYYIKAVDESGNEGTMGQPEFPMRIYLVTAAGAEPPVMRQTARPQQGYPGWWIYAAAITAGIVAAVLVMNDSGGDGGRNTGNVTIEVPLP